MYVLHFTNIYWPFVLPLFKIVAQVIFIYPFIDCGSPCHPCVTGHWPMEAKGAEAASGVQKAESPRQTEKISGSQVQSQLILFCQG